MKKNVLIITVIGVVVVLAVGAVLATSLFSGKEVNTDCTVSASELQATDLTPFDETGITVTPFTYTTENAITIRTQQFGINDEFVHESLVDGVSEIDLRNISSSTTTNITNAIAESSTRPILTDDYIFYNVWNNGADIAVFDRNNNTHTTIIDSTATERPLHFSNGYLVYALYQQQNQDFQFRVYKVQTQQDSLIKEIQNGRLFEGDKIDGNYFIWSDNTDSGDWDIYMYDLTNDNLTCVCDNPYDQSYPDISGDLVVWQDFRNNYNNDDPEASPPVYDHDFGDIYGYSIVNDHEFVIDGTVGVSSLRPKISGNVSSYFQCNCGSLNVPAAICFAIIGPIALPNPIQVTINSASTESSHKTPPRISGNWIVWGDDRSNGNKVFDVYGYSIADSCEFTISETNECKYPIVFDNVVIWMVDEEYDDLYGATLNTTGGQ